MTADLPPPVSAGVAVYRETSYFSPRKLAKLFVKLAHAKMAGERRKARVRSRIKIARTTGVKLKLGK